MNSLSDAPLRRQHDEDDLDQDAGTLQAQGELATPVARIEEPSHIPHK